MRTKASAIRRRSGSSSPWPKTLALAAGASNAHEAKAAELAARRVMEACNLDPVLIPNVSFVSHINFANNALLNKLREEWRAAHPHYSYKAGKDGHVRRLRGPVNTKRKRATPDPASMYEGMFADFRPETVNTRPAAKPTAKPVNTKPKPSSDRSRDRHSPGYMRDYMRGRRAADKRKGR